jgi:hypothetical protein
MALEHDNFQQYRECPDKYHDPHGSYQMNTRDYVLRPTADDQTGPAIITLPAVSEANGRFYSIITRNADQTNTITIEDKKDDSECWGGDIVLDARCDRVLLYSDGLAWHVLENADPDDPYQPYQPYN